MMTSITVSGANLQVNFGESLSIKNTSLVIIIICAARIIHPPKHSPTASKQLCITTLHYWSFRAFDHTSSVFGLILQSWSFTRTLILIMASEVSHVRSLSVCVEGLTSCRSGKTLSLNPHQTRFDDKADIVVLAAAR